MNTLTVMASESYEDFVDKLQKEIEVETGIVFGVLHPHSFNNITVEVHGTEPVYFGQENSSSVFDFLMLKGYISPKGKIQVLLKDDLRSEKVELPDDLEPHIRAQIIETLKQTAGKIEIKKHEHKQVIKVNENVLLSDEFRELWDKIKYKTTYSVNFDSSSLIRACQREISNNLVVSRGKLVYEKANLSITKAGVALAQDPETQYGVINQEVTVLPDIVSYLQNETQLTRKSIVEILHGCINLKYFKINPQKFIEGCIDIINTQMRLHVVDGIVYNRIGEEAVYSQKLFANEQLTGYLKSNMRQSSKSPYEHVVYDSGVESELTQEFERNKNIKVYAKLPNWFKIDTPLGAYNPDWAVLVEVEDEEQLFFVAETKGSLSFEFLRPVEKGKIECGKAHFNELANVDDSNIVLEHVSKMDDFINKVFAKLV